MAAVDRRSAHASVLVAGFTALSRATGLLRVLMVAAVLGPTHLGNVYLLTNTLPNLVWYGFLAGSLVPSVLVPVLVRHLEAGAPDELARVSRSFLGVVTLAGLVAVPVAVVGAPLLLHLATLGVPGSVAEEQVSLARLLVLLTLPQVLLYALVGTANAVLYSRRRFALAAAGPTIENLGVMLVLAIVVAVYGGPEAAAGAPTGLVVLLGAGSTAAVALNAGLQWWGARRCGVTLVPAGGWRDREVTTVLRRAARSVGTAGLLAAQTLVALLLASRVTGGTVALQISLNFYALPIALITTPIGLAVLPELARAWHAHDLKEFRSTYLQGLTSALFFAVPATVGFVLLARPLARAVVPGAMSGGAAEAMIVTSLAVLALGLAGQALTFVTTQAAFAAGDTGSPLACMAVQAVVCVGLGAVVAASMTGAAAVPAVAACYAAATLVGGVTLLLRVAGRWPELRTLLLPSLLRTATAAAVMAVVVASAVALVSGPISGPISGPVSGGVSGRSGSLLVVVTVALAGLVTYLVVARLLRAPELAWWAAGLRRRVEPPLAAGVAR